jgi:mRNA interferase MazF
LKNAKILRGDIHMATLETEESSRVIRGIRPVIVVSNNTVNYYSPVINVIPVTSQKKKPLPVHVDLSGFGLEKDSTAIVEQVLTIDKSSLVKRIGSLAGTEKMYEIVLALKIQLGVA